MATIPSFIGRFKIVNRIGRGGMGALYLAWDPTLEREIAIKLLREDNDELRERFAREARSVARLRHPHIVMVFDVGVHEDQPFIAMEYVKGQTLAEILSTGGRLTIARTLQLAEQLCDGLAYAHKAGIVHRDIKPANIMVDETDGSLKLLDFGIARVGPGMTQAGMLIGTLSYMSPEQVTGSAVDNRSDIFAVGAVLYELLTRQQAFPGRLDTGVLHKILHVAPEPLETLCPDLDPEVIQIVNRALEKDPAARYQELTAMRRDLQRVLRRLEEEAPRAPIGDETILMADPGSPPPVVPEPRLPTPTPRTPKGTDREALERRRATQIQTLLDAAGTALNGGDHDAVIARCEEVLLLDSDNARAWDLRDRAKAALDERQAGAWLDDARHHLERGELDPAADLADRALRLNPMADHASSIVRRIDEARLEEARQQQQIETCRSALTRARDLLDQNRFEDAAAAADQALAIDPDYPGALSVKQQAIEALQAEAKRREIANQLASDAIKEADRLAKSGDAGAALSLLEAFDPPHPDVTGARDALRAELEARRREEERRRAEELRADAERQERQRRIAAAMERATLALGGQDFSVALDILRTLQKSDPDAPGLEALVVDVQTQQAAAERAKQIAIEIRRHLAAASERFAGNDFSAAGTHVQRALALDPDHAEAQALATRIEAEARAAAERRAEEERRQRERDEAFAEAMSRAQGAATHDVAIAALREALALKPADQTARRLLKDHETVADVERRVSEAVARAGAASSAEGAIAILRQALQIAPSHPEVSRLLRAREEELAREQAEARRLRELEQAEARRVRELEQAEARRVREEAEAEAKRVREQAEAEARRVRERDEAIAAAIRAASKAASHAAALTELQKALDLDPGHAEARRLFAAREAALQQEQAAERRRQEVATACQEIEHHISEGELDAAEQRIAALEREADAKKAMKALRKRLRDARTAAAKRASAATVLINVPPETAGEPVSEARPASDDAPDPSSRTAARSPGIYAAGAAAAVLVLIGGYVVFVRPSSPPGVSENAPSATSAPAPTDAAPRAGDVKPPAPADRPAPQPRSEATTDAAPPSAAPPPVREAPSAAESQTARIESQVSPLRRLARQQLAAGAHPQALATVMSGLKLAPEDGELQRVVADLANAAQASVQRARQTAQAAGPTVVASATFKDAVARQELAARLGRSRQTERSLKAYWEAADLFTAAAAPGRSAAAVDPRTGPPPSTVPAPAPSPAAQPPAAAAPLPAPVPPPSTERPAPPPPAQVPTPAPSRPAAPQGPSDDSLIRSTLQAYARAYQTLDAGTVKQVYPSVDTTALSQAFAQMRAQSVQFDIDRITVSGASATVTCRVRQHFEPKAGRATDSNVTATFNLQKVDGGWVIVQRR